MSSSGRAPATGLGHFVALALGEDNVTADDERDFEELVVALAQYVDRNLAIERQHGGTDGPQDVAREIAAAVLAGELDPSQFGAASDLDPAALDLMRRTLAAGFHAIASIDPTEMLDEVIELDATARQNGLRSTLLERERAKALAVIAWCRKNGSVEALLQMPGLLDAWWHVLDERLEQRRLAGRYGRGAAAALVHRRRLARAAAELASHRLHLQLHEHDPPPPGGLLSRCHSIQRHGPPAGSCASAPRRAHSTRPVSPRRALNRRSAATSS